MGSSGKAVKECPPPDIEFEARRLLGPRENFPDWAEHLDHLADCCDSANIWKRIYNRAAELERERVRIEKGAAE